MFYRFLALMFFCPFLTSCGYNTLQQSDEQIKSAWSEVLNQYQRRADLIPNLVKTVKAYAAHEKEVLTEVTEARAKVGQMNASQDILNNPQAFAEFQKAQAQMGGALSHLLAVAENYPDLKADQSFVGLQAQLEGTENRIAVARGRYIKAVEKYNVTVRSFPSNFTASWFGFQTKPNFSVENEEALSKAPELEF